MHAQCSFMEYKNYKVVYRRYASLFFIVGIDSQEVRRRHAAQQHLRAESAKG